MTDPRPDTTNIIGYIASSLTTAAFVPQVLRTWRTRSVNDLSVVMLITFILGIVLWLVYGVAIQSPPVLVGNAVTLALNVMLLVMRLRYGGRR